MNHPQRKVHGDAVPIKSTCQKKPPADTQQVSQLAFISKEQAFQPFLCLFLQVFWPYKHNHKGQMEKQRALGGILTDST